jgi:hypothetical protein
VQTLQGRWKSQRRHPARSAGWVCLIRHPPPPTRWSSGRVGAAVEQEEASSCATTQMASYDVVLARVERTSFSLSGCDVFALRSLVGTLVHLV